MTKKKKNPELEALHKEIEEAAEAAAPKAKKPKETKIVVNDHQDDETTDAAENDQDIKDNKSEATEATEASEDIATEVDTDGVHDEEEVSNETVDTETADEPKVAGPAGPYKPKVPEESIS